jgi:hypothetical protein
LLVSLISAVKFGRQLFFFVTHQLADLVRGTKKQQFWSMNVQLDVIMVPSWKKYKIVFDPAIC